MKTLQNILEAKETKREVEILLKNGKKMFIDFGDNSICRFSTEKGVEQNRDFHCDTNKMFKLAITYLKKQ